MEVMVVHFCLELNKDPELDDKYLQANPYSFLEQTYPTNVNDLAYDPANR
jgi:hypothetical protein